MFQISEFYLTELIMGASNMSNKTDDQIKPSWTHKLLQLSIFRLIISLLLVAGSVQGIQLLMDVLGSYLFADESLPRYWMPLNWAVSILFAYLAYIFYVRFIEKRNVTELSVSGAVSELGLGVVVGTLLFILVIATLWGFDYYKLIAVNGLAFLIIPLFHYAYTAVYEEIIFRGIFFRIIENKLGSWIAIIISGLFFGFAHNATLYTNVSIALMGGVLFSAAYLYTRRLWLAIGIHFAWNFVQVGIFGLALSDKDGQGVLRSELIGKEIFSGGSYGIETSIITFVLVMLIGLIFLFKTQQRGNFIKPFWGVDKLSKVTN